jgi:hypothetical protein
MFSQFDFGSELTIVVLLCLLRVWFWFRVDHWRKHKRTTMVNSEPKLNSEETQEDDNGQLWTKIKLWVNIRGRQWSTLNQNQTEKTQEDDNGRVDHYRPLMFSQSLILVQSWPLSSSYVFSVWFWFRVDHCRPLMFTQSLILVQSWPLSSSYVYSEFNFGSELTIVVLLCFLRVN